MRTRLMLATLALLAMTSLGCATGKTTVIEAPPTPFKSGFAIVSERTPTVSIREGEREIVRQKLLRAVYSSGFSEGAGLKIDYCIVRYRTNAAGEGSITIDVKFLDAAYNPIGRIKVEAESDFGAISGSVNFAYDRAADEIAKYAKEHFLQR